MEFRQDKGALWENFVISESHKYLHNNKIHALSYFWRTTRHQEIDYIEEYGGNISAFEIKWRPHKQYKPPAIFSATYNASFAVVDPGYFIDFVT